MIDNSTDVRVDADGSIVRFTPITREGVDWIDSNIESEGWQWLGHALCVEHRYAQDIIAEMRNSGLQVSTAFC